MFNAARSLDHKLFVLVLSIDLAGFGESDDPFRLGSRDALDPALDVAAALSYLESLEDADAADVLVIGHSFGCIPAMSAGLDHPAVAAIVAIGPPRREAERFEDEAGFERYWQRCRRTRLYAYGTDYPESYTKEMWMEDRRRGGFHRYIETLAESPHPPVLLMDGGSESEANHVYMREFFDRITEPKAYVTVPDSNHYANTVSNAGLVWYDHKVVGRTVREIVSFWEQVRASKRS